MNSEIKNSKSPGYHIMTWGCQMNEEDSEQMSLYLEQMGYQNVGDAADAEVILLNTCSVRAKPEEKVWSELGRLKELKREKPDLIIGVCGCMAQVESAEIQKRAPFVDMIVGTGNIASIPDLIQRVKTGVPQEQRGFRRQYGNLLSLTEGKREESIAPTPNSLSLQAEPLNTRTPEHLNTLTALALPPRKGAIVADVPERKGERRPKLKAHVPIMYGCDKFCTFCIVPFTRGRERSRPTQEILAEIENLALGGTKEVTLLGQTVNSYGKNMPEGRVPFCDLLESIDKVRGLARIRFTSPYPRDFTDDLIEAIGRLEKVCEHVHLPLQVADDALLKEMHRGYTVGEFRAIVEKLRERVPGIAITTDVMLGYPGETDEQFWNTMRFVEEVRFDSAFMFAYSPRPNTKAALREDQLPQAVKIARLNQLIALQNAITVEINRTHIGETVEVLVEGRSQKDPSKLSGYTRTLKMTHFTVPEGRSRAIDSLIGKLVPVHVTESHLTGFIGEYAG
jgi:tRNA-2-methylthio-N6-dimethylallyladenosine synthase